MQLNGLYRSSYYNFSSNKFGTDIISIIQFCRILILKIQP